MFDITVSYPAAFLAGLLSFFSPCILPLIPAYFSFISGYSLEELTGDIHAEARAKVVISTLAFILGFTFVFVLLGASATFLGSLFFKYGSVIRTVGGLIIIIFGVHLTGLIRIKPLEFEKRVHLEKKPLHFGGAFIIGMAFVAGWTPCIGPILGSILIVAGNQDTVWQGIWLLSVYSAGMAFPFLVLSVFIGFLINFLKNATRAVKYVNTGAGVLLILIGLLLLTNQLNLLSMPG
jgi:cytochrome c-type biogenesis protein